MGSGTRDLSILLDAVPRCVSVRVLPRNSGVLCFACRRSGSVLFRPARSRQQDVSRPCASMATQAWLNGETGATAAAGAEARAAQPGVAEARAAQPGPRGTSRGDIVAHVRMVHLRTAHNFMSKWRKKTDGTAETEKDLTDRQDFDWVGYLKAYPNLSVIVPDGKVVVRFAIARLAIIDTNTRTGRVDFLLFLDDGICVRLHPSQTKEALPVIVPADRTGILFGRKAMSDTVLEVKRGSHVVEARAAQPGVAEGRAAQPAPPEKSRDHFKGASESDILMPSFVLSWLAERAALWPTMKFCQEITTQVVPLAPRNEPLPWPYFVAGVPLLKAMQPFAAVYVVWVDGPALYFRAESGDEVVVKLGDSGMKGVTLHRDLVHKCRWYD